MEATSITVRVGRFGMLGCSLVVVLCLGSEHCEGSRSCFSFLAWSPMCGLSGVLRWPSVVFHGSPSTRKGLMRPNCDAISLITFEANHALVLLFSMLEFGSVSCYGCSFVWIFCIRLAMFSFCVTYLFFPDVKIWPKKNHEFFGQI